MRRRRRWTKAAGVNRFAWDLRYPAPLTLPYGYYGNLLEYTEYTLADHAIAGLDAARAAARPAGCARQVHGRARVRG